MASVPPSVPVLAGATSATFTIPTQPVGSSMPVVITAAFGGASRAATLTVAPATPPAAPTLLSPANDAGPAQPVTFDWSDVTGAATYTIQIDNSSTFGAPFVATQSVAVSQATIGGLPAQQLWWPVRGVNSAGAPGAWSATRRVEPLAAAPADGDSHADPDAHADEDRDGWRAHGHADADSDAHPNGDVGWSNRNPDPDTDAHPDGDGVWSDRHADPDAHADPDSDVGRAAPGAHAHRAAARCALRPGQTITFDWSDVAGAANYTLQIDDSDGFGSPLVMTQTPTASQFSTSTLAVETMWWRVRANPPSGSPGAWSAVRRFEVKDWTGRDSSGVPSARPDRHDPCSRVRVEVARAVPSSKARALASRLPRGLLRARRKFLRIFPEGFRDETYLDWERNYKVAAHHAFEEALGATEFRKLLEEGRHAEAASRAIRVESRTHLLFSFEKMALRDAVRSPEAAGRFAEGLFDFLHGDGPLESRFIFWCEVLAGLPAARLGS